MHSTVDEKPCQVENCVCDPVFARASFAQGPPWHVMISGNEPPRPGLYFVVTTKRTGMVSAPSPVGMSSTPLRRFCVVYGLPDRRIAATSSNWRFVRTARS